MTISSPNVHGAIITSLYNVWDFSDINTFRLNIRMQIMQKSKNLLILLHFRHYYIHSKSNEFNYHTLENQ